MGYYICFKSAHTLNPETVDNPPSTSKHRPSWKLTDCESLAHMVPQHPSTQDISTRKQGCDETYAESLSCVQLFAAPWTAAHQVLLSVELSRQAYWRGLLFPTPGDLPNPEIEPKSPASPALAGGFFTTPPPGLHPGHRQAEHSVCWERHNSFHANSFHFLVKNIK